MHDDAARPGSVLVVDDDSAMCAVLKDFLEQHGHRVLLRSSGEDALDLLGLEPLDVVILDKEMSGMNGLEVLSFITRSRPELPVILITAFGGRDTAEQALGLGARFYLEKPFRLARVRELVDYLVGAAGPSRREARR
jgi:DNA-binding NtrC family response regulator